ncbi:diaminopimelate decarboxylase [Arthrobacter agilis]|uniref:diaminopimelate decarboxylase family protein n=1 Tax=Arthrobacter agilis TaxID=37921 RepID=UPI002366347B|nr:diaminopimelate decarboxylase [Arthrobacter agilis]WDF32332.1 diaminopimelate decarboxylase [Arthrobacter agilis]
MAGRAAPRDASPLAPDWLSLPADQARLDAKLWAEDVERGTDGVLSIDGVSVAELAEEFGTPLFVMSERDFRARAATFRDAFDDAFRDLCGGVDVFYAGKSFLCTEVAHWVREEGLGLDTCSGGELAVALRAGMPGHRLGLHGNNKSAAEITRAIDAGLGRIVVDSLQEVALVGDLAVRRGRTANVMIRLTPGVHAHTHEFIATAHEDQKFGLSLTAEQGPGQLDDSEDGAQVQGDGIDGDSSPAARAVADALAHPGINLLGVHCHIGSQIFEPEGFELAAQRLLGFLAGVRDRHGVELPELDLGGGYGIAYTEADQPRPAAEIARAMAAVVGSTCTELGLRVPRISIEPGRAIVGPTTFTLYTAGTTKTVRVDAAANGSEVLHDTSVTQPRRYVSVDGGMSDNARPVLYGADYSAVLASRTPDAAPVLSRVVGKHCESGDIVVRDVYLPEDTGAGDLLAVPGTGAYCWVLSSNYNYLTRPPVVAVVDGAARLIVRGETEEDLFRRDVQREPAPRTPAPATDPGDPRTA